MNENIKKYGGNPFKISFSYDTCDLLKKLKILPESFDRYDSGLFYLPDDYKIDIERFNKYAREKKSKEVAEELADVAKMISLN